VPRLQLDVLRLAWWHRRLRTEDVVSFGSLQLPLCPRKLESRVATIAQMIMEGHGVASLIFGEPLGCLRHKDEVSRRRCKILDLVAPVY